jgi:hypothetical protein
LQRLPLNHRAHIIEHQTAHRRAYRRRISAKQHTDQAAHAGAREHVEAQAGALAMIAARHFEQLWRVVQAQHLRAGRSHARAEETVAAAESEFQPLKV